MGISGSVVASIVTAIIAASAAAYSAYESGQAQAEMAKGMARQEENRAKASRDAAQIQADQAKERNKRVRALARARAEASGVASDEGSPLLVELENARQSQLEENLILYGGEVQSQFLQQESRLMTFRGAQARRAGNIGAGTSLLAGVSSAAGTYASAPRTTAPNSGIGYGAASRPPDGNHPY